MGKTQSKRTSPQELQKKRVEWAWQSVGVAAESRGKQDEYLTEARKLPARILASGLGQSLAYLYSKRKPPRDRKPAPTQGRDLLYRHVSERIEEVLGKASAGSEGAMPLVVELSATEYRRLSRELLTSSEWLKRFAEGRLKDTSEGGEP